jgi:hypothetical protein
MIYSEQGKAVDVKCQETDEQYLKVYNVQTIHFVRISDVLTFFTFKHIYCKGILV